MTTNVGPAHRTLYQSSPVKGECRAAAIGERSERTLERAATFGGRWAGPKFRVWSGMIGRVTRETQHAAVLGPVGAAWSPTPVARRATTKQNSRSHSPQPVKLRGRVTAPLSASTQPPQVFGLSLSLVLAWATPEGLAKRAFGPKARPGQSPVWALSRLGHWLQDLPKKISSSPPTLEPNQTRKRRRILPRPISCPFPDKRHSWPGSLQKALQALLKTSSKPPQIQARKGFPAHSRILNNTFSRRWV
mgnify:CR=1 FL=1